MLYFSLAAAAALAVAATAAVDIPLTIADELLEFQAQDLIPRPVPTGSYNLTSALTLAFSSANITTGQSYTLPADQSTLASAPTFQLDVPPALAAQYAKTNFTAILCDPGAYNSTLGGTKVTRHYLANDLTLSSGRLTNSTPAITSYNAPGPAAGTGAHRYLALVFAQEAGFQPPSDLNSAQPLANMTLGDYIKDADNLGEIVAMTFFLVENTSEGTKSVSTASVPSASVAAAAATIASSLGISTGTASSSGSTSTGSTSAATPVAVSKGAAVAALLGALGVAIGAWAL